MGERRGLKGGRSTSLSIKSSSRGNTAAYNISCSRLTFTLFDYEREKSLQVPTIVADASTAPDRIYSRAWDLNS